MSGIHHRVEDVEIARNLTPQELGRGAFCCADELAVGIVSDALDIGLRGIDGEAQNWWVP